MHIYLSNLFVFNSIFTRFYISHFSFKKGSQSLSNSISQFSSCKRNLTFNSFCGNDELSEVILEKSPSYFNLSSFTIKVFQDHTKILKLSLFKAKKLMFLIIIIIICSSPLSKKLLKKNCAINLANQISLRLY